MSLLIVTPAIAWLAFDSAVRWWPEQQATLASPVSTSIEDRNGVALATFVADDGQWRIPLARDEINPHLIDAIVAVEDARFFEHHGVDWKSVAAAGWEDLSHLSARRGASTLTMQLQRLRDPRPRSWWNKLEQAIRAEQLERHGSKQEILVEYVNAAPFGGNLVGAGAASWRYFGRPCRELSLGEAALLAGLPQSPNRLRPDRYPNRAKLRRDHVLDRMLACGLISRQQRDEAANEPVVAKWRPLPQDRPADCPLADGSLPALLHVARSQPGSNVRSTIDANLQRQVCLAAREQLGALASSGVSSAAVLVLDTRSSELLATVSLGGETVAMDLTRRPRSTGSTLKPFIYAAAFDAGVYGPGSILSDSPAAWPGYQPNDYDRAFRGSVSAAEALAESRNIPAMLVLSKVGIEPAVGVMDSAGIHGLSHDAGRYGLSLAIGGAEATPIEIASAYATLGRGGVPQNVSEILSTPHHDPQPARRCLREQTSWQVLNAISEGARTSGVCPEAAPSHAAWKTGTSSGHRDAWCAAVTRRRTVVVWLGNTGGQSSPALVGQEAAAPLALRIMSLLDPADEPWPVVKDSIVAERRTTGSESELVLVRPTEGQQLVLTSDSTLDRQRVLLEARHRRDTGMLWWFVDGRAV
ncbi:MAG TPA: penicillin-binding protein 1C, partial [Tepidisphaeraceae bacterium]|nr:penicillin-binding protein 1C [Tepidisphaeraceae bacterium]